MNPEIVGLMGFAILFIFMYLGMPIGYCLAFTGFIGNVFLFSWQGAVLQLGMVPYTTVSSYTLCIIPLFTIMGSLAFSSGLSSKSFSFMYKVFGRLKGGLAMTTIAASAVFAACVGSSMASAITMTQVAMPEMTKYKYKPELATGAIAAGGTLGMLIPPSAPLILYSLITGTSIGKLWIAGVAPGIVLSVLFVITIGFIVRFRPDWGPSGEKASMLEIAKEAKGIWSPVLLIVIVLGGLWTGVFTPSQAGGVGTLITLLILIGFKRKASLKYLGQDLKSTCENTAMIFMIVIGAMIFGDFVTASTLPQYLIQLIIKFQLSPFIVILALMCVYVVLGALMDELAVMLITIPIIAPALNNLGIDMVWFGILFIINQQMGLILPPVGMIVFVLSGMLPDIGMYTIYKGIIPFAIAMFAGIILIMVFPQIAMWLPNLLM